MKWTVWKDLGAFTWYIITEPVRRIRHQFRTAFYNTKKDMQNLRLWSDFSLLMSVFSIVLDKIDLAVMFLILAFVFRLYYEWRSKRYRHEWNKRRDPQ